MLLKIVLFGYNKRCFLQYIFKINTLISLRICLIVLKCYWTLATFKTIHTKLLPSNRVQFSKMHVVYGKTWEDVFFSDKKKLNLDKPNGFHYYWHDLWWEKAIVSKRQCKAGNNAYNETTPRAIFE